MIKFLAIGLLATVSAVSAQTQTPDSRRVAFYATPSAVIVYPGDFDNAGGAALALGATIREVHSIEAEVISFKTNPKGGSDDFTFTPVLLTYKYDFVLSGKFTVTAGASIGATFEKGEYFTPPMYNSPGAGYFYNVNETAFTSGLLGGVSYALSNQISIDANAHLLRLEETDITTAGNIAIVSVGMKIRF